MKIIDLGINGEGIAKENGKVVFIENALVNEDVEIEITSENKNFSKAKAIKINKKSSNRVEPLCPYFLKCGGCQLQHMDYDCQLEFKKKLVENTLKKIANIDFSVSETISSDDIFFYRNKSSFPIVFKDNKVYIGMYENLSHNLIEIGECKISKPLINKVLKITENYLKTNKTNKLKHLVVREVGGKALITIVSTTKNIDLSGYTKVLEAENIDFSLTLNLNQDEKHILSNEFIDIYGDNSKEVEDFGLRHKVNPASFMQINDSVKEKLYLKILENIENETVVDAYSGAGVLSGMIAKKAKFVYGIEISKSAIDLANQLAIDNKIENLTFICGNCKTEIPKLLPNIEEDFITILDPPRSGCDKDVLDAILTTKPHKVLYVSCNPITLSRDLKILSECYDIKSITPFDMFPQTSNVEVFTVLNIK